MSDDEKSNCLQGEQDKQSKIEILHVERKQIKASLNRFAKFLDGFTVDNIENLELRLRSIEDSVLKDFKAVQNTLELLDVSEIDSDERGNFEDQYFSCTARAVKIIREFYENKSLPGLINNAQNTVPQIPKTSHIPSATSTKGFPSIELIKFHGEYEKWAQFRDLFKTLLVHDDQSIDKVRKFYYLLSSLKGDASKVVESIEVTEQNYDLAWGLLSERYENKELTIKNHVKALFDLPTVSKDKYTVRNLLDEFQKRFRALKLLGEPVDHWSTLLIHLIITKLDLRTVTLWEEFIIAQKSKHPSLNQLLEFLSDRCKFLETTDTFKKMNIKETRPPVPSRFDNKRQHQSYAFQKGNVILECLFCKGKHQIYRCEKLANLSVTSRIEEIKRLNLCINCLRGNHAYAECISQGCKVCSKRHNTLLHEDNPDDRVTPNPEKSCSVISNHSLKNNSEILLSTAGVLIQDRDGNWLHCRALLDSGSQSNFMTKKLANKLNLQLYKTNIPVVGIGDSFRNISHRVSTNIKSVNENYNTNAHFLVLDRITEKLPSQSFEKLTLKLPDNITLADRNFNMSNTVDLLLGVTIFHQTLRNKQIQLGSNLPILQSTSFGWVLAGPVPVHRQIKSTTCHFSSSISESNIENQLQKFWEIEEYPSKKFYTEQEQDCEKLFVQTLKRDDNGNFVTVLPIRKDSGLLGDSLDSAVRRLRSMERKFRKDPEFKKQYFEFMSEYERMGHMLKIDSENINLENNGKNIFYLPHFGVKNETSTTTALRVVFDGSCQSSTGLSLNDILMVGPVIQDDLFSILVRFRQHTVVITADVAKMYRQVKITESQRNLQRIVWRKDPESNLSHYQLTTVTYGTAPASFLATRALQQAAFENQKEFPDASNVILTDFYVDDLITGTDNIQDALKIKLEISQILDAYGFPLRKWVSNYPDVVEQQNLDSSDGYYIHKGDIKRTLGLVWHAKRDLLTYEAKDIPIKNLKITKRSILSTLSSLFDPLGLLSPIIIRAKILMQQIWQRKENWDSPLPQNINASWLTLVKEFSLLSDININRHVLIPHAKYVELHAFCDASESSYGTCIYLRSIDGSGSCFTQLLCAKSRVAPLKTISIPRLELCGAVLSTRLCQKVQSSLKLQISKVCFWTDSMIVLGWLALSPSNLKVFVANRVSEIQTHSAISQWRHVPTTDNPADLVSRGVIVVTLQNSDLWWLGPKWLRDNDCKRWPLSKSIPENVPETKTNKMLLTLTNENKFEIFERFSNLFRLLRVVAYCYRFYHNCKNKIKNRQSLSVDEIQKVFSILLKLAQKEMFPDELKTVKNGAPIDKKSNLLSLSPILTQDGLLRVGGRISKANLSFDTKHQIILSPKHPLTKLIILHEHYKNLHAGILSILSSLREKFWIVHGRRAIRSVLQNCVTCFRVNPKRIIQKMGDLPVDRVTPYRPFLVTGVDFAGPFLIKDGKLRNRATVKAYLCIFICFSTKAVHLEAVGDLSTTIKTPCVSDFLLKNSITWNFIPPRSPHHGGIWEAAVKRAKYHVIRVIGKSHLTFEKLSTLFAQVEAAINSAPITPLSDDPSDLSCLTPGHFLIGAPLLSIPDADLTEISENRLSQFQIIQQTFQVFWKRWSKDYLLNLQQRTKWKTNSTDVLKVGSVVVLIDDNLPPLYWRMGRVIATHPGADNIVRVVTVKTANGELQRAVQKLCPLPMEPQVLET